VQSKNKIEILDKILQPSMINYYSSFHLEKITDFAYSINNQQINILKKLPFNETPFVFDSLDSKQVCYFKFENDKLNIITKSLNKKDVVTLLEKNETDYWPQISYDNNCYVLHDYDVVFKLNHYVQKTTKDGIYYLMTTFLNSFMFIKVITDQNIVINESVKLYTYQELFNKGTQILEMYLLIQDDDIENEE